MTLPAPEPLETSDSAHDTPTAQAVRQVYRGVWKVLADLFRVPRDPPTLPVSPNETLSVLRPARGFLHYLRLRLVIGLIIAALLMIGGIGGASLGNLLMGIVGLPVAVAIEVVSGLVGFLAIQLRYDSTWYLLSERSLRIRRGIWVIHETTITFENVQNVRVKQGPLQRWLGIANVVIDTAGGGADLRDAGGEGHRGKMEGIADAERVRDLILMRLERCRTSGLGDEGALELAQEAAALDGFTARHEALLSEIGALARQL